MGLVAMILGFIVFWPIGIAVLFYNMFARKGGELPFTMPPGSHFWSRPTTGNSAFEEWRKAEIERIEQERKKLHEAEREFSVFLDELKRVKDREEFERFMKARKGWTGPEGEPKAEPAACACSRSSPRPRRSRFISLPQPPRSSRARRCCF